MNILFTGCSTGFGAHIREKLLEQGHRVFGVGVNGPDLEVNYLDYSFDRLDNMAAGVLNQAEKHFQGTVHVLINNAGITHIEFQPRHSTNDFAKVMHVNLFAAYALSRRFIHHAEENVELGIPDTWLPFYRMIHTSSMGARQALRASPGYCASKAGIEAMSRTFARELAGKLPITSVAVAPGGVDGTEMMKQVVRSLMETRGMSEQEAIAYSRPSPLGRNCTYEELWQVYNFAVNSCPEYMSGTVLQMSGALGI